MTVGGITLPPNGEKKRNIDPVSRRLCPCKLVCPGLPIHCKEPLRGGGVVRGKERNGQGTHKRGNDHLKFSRASGQRCGPTLHWYSVAMNKQGGQFDGALWANTRAVLQVFFFCLRGKCVCRFNAGKQGETIWKAPSLHPFG